MFAKKFTVEALFAICGLAALAQQDVKSGLRARDSQAYAFCVDALKRHQDVALINELKKHNSFLIYIAKYNGDWGVYSSWALLSNQNYKPSNDKLKIAHLGKPELKLAQEWARRLHSKIGDAEFISGGYASLFTEFYQVVVYCDGWTSNTILNQVGTKYNGTRDRVVNLGAHLEVGEFLNNLSVLLGKEEFYGSIYGVHPDYTLESVQKWIPKTRVNGKK